MNWLTLGVSAIGVVLAWWAQQKQGSNTTIVPITPTKGQGITTGFAEPLVQTLAASLPTASGTSATPNTSQSGVPNSSAQTQSTALVAGQPIASPGAGAGAPFYYPIQQFLASMVPQPASQPSMVPSPGAKLANSNPKGNDCDCGGSGGSGSGGCGSVPNRRSKFTDGNSCMAVSKSQQINNTSPRLLNQLYNNLVSSGSLDPYATLQQMQFDGDQNDPAREAPVTPFVGWGS